MMGEVSGMFTVLSSSTRVGCVSTAMVGLNAHIAAKVSSDKNDVVVPRTQ